jgi:hypothetical protein
MEFGRTLTACDFRSLSDHAENVDESELVLPPTIFEFGNRLSG